MVASTQLLVLCTVYLLTEEQRRLGECQANLDDMDKRVVLKVASKFTPGGRQSFAVATPMYGTLRQISLAQVP